MHGEDIVRALGGYRSRPDAALLAVADFHQRGDLLVGARGRVAGLRMAATGADRCRGDGPPVRGPLAAPVLAMTGRGAALADLTGDGVARPRARTRVAPPVSG